VEALRPASTAVFEAIARLPPDSLPGRLFYGSFAPLPGLVGENALALHAALLGLPWLGLAVLVGRRLARPAGAGRPRPGARFVLVRAKSAR
jgi:hypothetical protein